jgi:hypothetical protein
MARQAKKEEKKEQQISEAHQLGDLCVWQL